MSHDLCRHPAAPQVVSVDCNPAQSALLELKAVAIRQLQHEDVWAMFGEGRHPRFEELYERQLAPFLSQKAHAFWSSRTWYFSQGLYYQGGMVGGGGRWCWVLVELDMCAWLPAWTPGQGAGGVGGQMLCTGVAACPLACKLSSCAALQP